MPHNQTSPGKVLEVELSSILRNPYQPRKQFDDAELTQLAQSIEQVGLLHPPLVRELPEGFYELISGERRMRACELVGLVKIIVVVREASDEQSAHAALIENVQRVDLNAVEIAEGLHRLMEEFHYSQREVAHQIGKRRSTVANYLRLLSLPKEVCDSLKSGQITMGHAKVILSQEGKKRQLLLFHKILQMKMTVRNAETVAAKNNTGYTEDVHLQALRKRMEERLGTSVTVKGKQSGKIIIDYHSLDDFDRLLEILG